MNAIATEADIIAIALAIVSPRHLYPAEACLGKPCADAKLVASVRRDIAEGGDPLGEAFLRIRSAAVRRTNGAVYTPQAIIDAMISWAFTRGKPDRIIDPGCGSGRYAIAAGRVWPHAEIVAVDLDPLATLMTKAALTVHRMMGRSTVQLCSYNEAIIPSIDGISLFIGNPPYVRHHDIDTKQKEWLSRTSAAFGVRASQLAGLHVHFFVRTLELARKGDLGCFITSAEWLDVNYGDALRRLLAGKLGGESIHMVRAEAMPFADAMTTGAITCFRPWQKTDSIRFEDVSSVAGLTRLDGGTERLRAEAVELPRWSILIRPGPARPAGSIELGEIARVSRGQVTGNNAAWIDGLHSAKVPERFKLPTITRAKELIAAGTVLTSDQHLKRLVNLPVDLSELRDDEREGVDRFLDWCRREGVPTGYVACHRKAWHAISLYEPAPILCTYMARRAPAFVRNAAGARHINIAHGIYPRQAMELNQLNELVRRLTLSVGIESGRTYAGGLTKFEPGELERIVLAPAEELS